MAQYRIVCTEQVPYGHPPESARIVAVGVGNDPQRASVRWTVGEVVAAMDRGDVFYTVGERSQKVALVEKYWCTRCVAYHIRSAADAVTDNNLDSMRYCNWGKSA
jgi:hypothetical protein